MLKKLIIIPYTLLMVCMGLATIIERSHGTDQANSYVYDSPWFVALWMMVAVGGAVYIVRRKLYRRLCVFTLHLSLLGILLGALVTHLTAQRGSVDMRIDEEVTTFVTDHNIIAPLPFALKLSDFQVVYYSGTDMPQNYVGTLYCTTTDESLQVSMNNIGNIGGYRFCLSNFDKDFKGCSMLVSHDRYGIFLTYLFYSLLLLSIVGLALGKLRPKFSLLRISIICFFFASAPLLHAKVNISPSAYRGFESVAVLYNGRVCPLNTAAIDYVTKLSGKPTWNGLSANAIFVGWMIDYDYWERQPIIKVKSAKVQRILGIGDQWASVRDFYTSDHRYKLQPHLENRPNDRELLDADEKVRVVSMFYSGEFLKVFPYQDQWYAPGSTSLPVDVAEKEFQFIKHAMDRLVVVLLNNNHEQSHEMIAKIKNYQSAHVALPKLLKLEVFYNTILSWRMIVFIFLSISIVLCILGMIKSSHHNVVIACIILGILLFAYVSILIAVRWIISGHVPLSNGFETMQFMSWAVIGLTFLLHRRIAILTYTGPLLASVALLVSVIASGSPQVTPLMPVLQSPLLTLHVLCVMMAYAVFALLAIASLAALVSRQSPSHDMLLTWNLLGVVMLTLGIFLGAVWANVSWGRYWGWDPKETWALITLMLYAIPLHSSLINIKGRNYHWFMVLAFLSVIMTYLGVNFLLPGLHSYS